MRLHPSAGWAPALLVALGGLLAAGPATAATLTCGTASGLAGQTVTVSLSTTDLTGLGVTSYQFRVAYNAGVVTASGVSTVGTLTGTAGWATPMFNVTSGQNDVSAAGTTALTGAGPLLKVTFDIDPALLNGGSTTLTLSNALMNEGTPPVVTANGSITVTATPKITVSPNTGELVRGSTLQFTVSGSVSNPVTWGTTDAGIATIGATGLLTGVAPGAVRVFAVDNAGKRDTTDGDVLVRGMGVTVGTVPATVNQTVSVPVTVTSLNGLAVRAGEIRVSFSSTYLSFVSATRPVGTLLNGYGSMSASASTSGGTVTVTVDFAGSTDLTGAGTLCSLDLATDPVNHASVALTLQSALFNETLPALRTNGAVNIATPATFTVNPASVTLLAGQTQQFTLSGSPVPPITWSTLDPAVATINSSGLLTAVAGGVTQVKAMDSSGGTALNTSVTVYDFALTVGTVTALPGATVIMPLTLDRTVGALGVQAVELGLSWTPTYVTAASFLPLGLLSAWGAPAVRAASGSMQLAAAGATALTNASQVLGYLSLTTSAATPVPTDIPVSLTTTTFNEGKPIARVTNGTLRARSGADVEEGASPVFALAPPRPNPARGPTRLSFTLPVAAAGGGGVRLVICGTDGRLVRTLLEGSVPAGPHEVVWDTQGDDGRPVAPGVYFCRLEWMGRTLERKLAVLR
jgi:hypothetical protein